MDRIFAIPGFVKISISSSLITFQLLFGLSASVYAADGELILTREVPPRVAYRRAPPGPATAKIDTSPVEMLDALKPEARVIGDPFLVGGVELSDADVSAISAGAPRGAPMPTPALLETMVSGSRSAAGAMSRPIQPGVAPGAELMGGAMRAIPVVDMVKHATSEIVGTVRAITAIADRP